MTKTTATKKPKDAAAADTLRERGAELLKAEDRFGETKTGWWIDGVYLGAKNDASHCLRIMDGAG